MAEGGRILVVDDDPYTRDLAGTALRAQGYEVVGAARFGQALAAARELRPRLIVADVVLPDGSGLDLAKALRDELPAPDRPIFILMSAFSRGRLADQREMKEQAGAVAFLAKPLAIPALIDLVVQQLPPAAQAAAMAALPDADTSRLMRADALASDEAPADTGPPDDARPDAEESAREPGAPGPRAARARAPMPAAPTRPVPTLLAGLANAWRKGWTGTLEVARTSARKTILIEGGEIVWATTSLTDERLGRVMLRLGFLPRDQYEPSLKEAAATGRRVGEVLVARGYVTSWQLDDALTQQMEQIVLGALGWPDGTHRVTARTGSLDTPDRVAVSPIPRLVVRAFAEVISPERLDAALEALGPAPIAAGPGVPPGALEQLAPTLEESQFLSALKAPMPVDKALGLHPSGPEAARPFLGALLALGLVTRAVQTDRPRAADGRAAPAPAEARPAAPRPSPGAASPAERQAAEAAARRLLEAEAAFEAGRQAAERDDLAAASAALDRAVSLCPDEGEYRAWAAWVSALAARARFDAALDAVAGEMEAAAGLTPSSEGIFELVERVIRLRMSYGVAESR